jgi:DNA-binding response OmpR family regulator
VVRILVVNPHPVWAQRIASRLTSAGASVAVAGESSSALASLNREWPDLLVIERRTLEKEAEHWLAALREGESTQLVVVTALGQLSTDSGQASPRGEDALRRLEALTMRLQGVFASGAQQSIRVGKLTIDSTRKQVVFAAKRISLPPHQFHLLLYLALNAPRVVSQSELVREIWGFTESGQDDRELVKAHVRQIRRRLGWTEEGTNYLRSVRGFGYTLGPP